MDELNFIDDVLVERLARAVMAGWSGYRNYQDRSLLLADEKFARSQAKFSMTAAKKALDKVENEFRRAFLPRPTREKPRPDPEAVEGAARLEAMAIATGALVSRLAIHPVPDQYTVNQRFDRDRGVFAEMTRLDLRLVGLGEILRVGVADRTSAWLLERESSVKEGVEALGETLSLRERCLAARL